MKNELDDLLCVKGLTDDHGEPQVTTTQVKEKFDRH